MPGGGSHGELRGPPGPAGSTLSGSDLRDTDRGPSAQGMFLRLGGMDVAQRNRAAGSAWLGHWHSDSEKDGRLPVTWGGPAPVRAAKNADSRQLCDPVGLCDCELYFARAPC